MVYERVERLKDTPFDCWCSLMLIISIRLGNTPGKLVTSQLRDDGVNLPSMCFAGSADYIERCSVSAKEASLSNLKKRSLPLYGREDALK